MSYNARRYPSRWAVLGVLPIAEQEVSGRRIRIKSILIKRPLRRKQQIPKIKREIVVVAAIQAIFGEREAHRAEN